MTPLRNVLLTTSLCLATILYNPAQAENVAMDPISLRKAAIEASKAEQWPQSLEAWGRYLQIRPMNRRASSAPHSLSWDNTLICSPLPLTVCA